MDGMDIFYDDMFSPKAAIWLAEKALQQGKPVIYNMQGAREVSWELVGQAVKRLRR